MRSSHSDTPLPKLSSTLEQQLFCIRACSSQFQTLNMFRCIYEIPSLTTPMSDQPKSCEIDIPRCDPERDLGQRILEYLRLLGPKASQLESHPTVVPRLARWS
ncbi:hypothetical protein Ae201684_001591 [Aphanomyces euteiches]|uniref:Uncharacterized protein n=1 Tax=Aphanomyces euteiches TaxID=100861 RepID=A0A6G0XU38_9STRA|nr:hypothetical protein Ae201684_001591 [Aphanomyces euteiches]